MTTPSSLTQDELKTLVGQAALQYVVPGDIVGVGTGSTVNKFIDALASIKSTIKGLFPALWPAPNVFRLWVFRCLMRTKCSLCRCTSMVRTKSTATAT